MEFKHKLPNHLIQKALDFREFANGGAQVTVKLKDGRIFEKALISNATAIIALRGYSELPFPVEEVSEIYQTEEDQSPQQRGGWEFWDDWQQKKQHT